MVAALSRQRVRRYNLPMPADARPAITPEDVRHVAKLARLAIDESRLPALAMQLEPILHYIEQLNAVDVTGVEPMAHAVPLHNVLRDDVPGPALPLELTLQNAPETDGPFFKVPKILGGDEDSAG
jgi:aspartyl-tRNA(Asn)/glutamyl-tRNA(Gln) amidotransferase subunit C